MSWYLKTALDLSRCTELEIMPLYMLKDFQNDWHFNLKYTHAHKQKNRYQYAHTHTHTHTHRESLPGLQRVWCWWGEPARGGPTEIPAGPMTHKQCAHTPPTEFCTTERKRERKNNNTHTAFIEQVHLWKHGKQMRIKEKTTRAPCLSALCCCFCLLLEIFRYENKLISPPNV